MFIDPTPFGPSEVNKSQQADSDGGLVVTLTATLISAAVIYIAIRMEE